MNQVVNNDLLEVLFANTSEDKKKFGPIHLCRFSRANQHFLYTALVEKTGI
jgi:hypothetical protein